MNYYYDFDGDEIEMIYGDPRHPMYLQRMRKRSPHGPDGLWLDPNSRRTKRDYPYSYSDFFLIGNHKSINKCSADYSDRYSSWGIEKYEAAWNAVGEKKGYRNSSASDMDKFVKAYYGETFEFTGLVEGCNASSGYPYFVVYYKDTKKVENV